MNAFGEPSVFLFRDWLKEKGAALVVLDFDGVDFIDSSGLGMLVKLLKHLVLSGELVLCCIHSKPIMDLLVMTRMNKAIMIKENIKEALSAFQ